MRHDLHADGMLIKTIYDRGVGYDRPFDFDEVKIDLKVYQIIEGQEVIYQNYEDLNTLMHEKKYITNTLKNIM